MSRLNYGDIVSLFNYFQGYEILMAPYTYMYKPQPWHLELQARHSMFCVPFLEVILDISVSNIAKSFGVGEAGIGGGRI